MYASALASAVVNLVLFVAIPLGAFALYHRLRRKRPWREITERAGLRLGGARYIGIGALVGAAFGALVWLVPLPMPEGDNESWAFSRFLGLGLGFPAITLALLYGVVQTGFCEELFFRGLIAGSLARWLGTRWGNLVQALVFLGPHLLLLLVIPEQWPVLPLVLVIGLVLGWLRIESGSIVGPWIAHAAGNVATALSVAHRSG